MKEKECAGGAKLRGTEESWSVLLEDLLDDEEGQQFPQ